MMQSDFECGFKAEGTVQYTEKEGRLSESEIKWLKNRTRDMRPEAAGLAQEIYWQCFPYVERNAMKKQLVINRLAFEIHGEVWDSYGNCIIAN